MCCNELTNRPRLQKQFPQDCLRHLLIQPTNVDGRICTYNATLVSEYVCVCRPFAINHTRSRPGIRVVTI